MIEHRYQDEKVAHDARRVLIAKGVRVSLIAFDPARNCYVFDSYR